MSPIPFLYFLLRKGQQSGPSSASQRYQDAMRFGSPAEKLREASRKTVRELFAFWIIGFVVLMFVLPTPAADSAPLMSGYDFTIPAIFWSVLLVDSLAFAPAWLLYRLVRFALPRRVGTEHLSTWTYLRMHPLFSIMMFWITISLCAVWLLYLLWPRHG